MDRLSGQQRRLRWAVLAGAMLLGVLTVGLQRAPLHWRLPVDASLRPDQIDAIWEPETAPSGVYRWTQAHTTIHLPPLVALTTLWVRAATTTPLTLTLGAYALQAVAEPELRQLVVYVPPRTAQLQLHSATFRASGDGRELGVILETSGLSGRWSGQALWSWAGVWLALLPLLLALAVGARWPAALGATSLGLLLLAVLIQVQGAWLLADGATLLACLAAAGYLLRQLRAYLPAFGLPLAGTVLLAVALAGAGLWSPLWAWGVQPILALPAWVHTLLPPLLLLFGALLTHTGLPSLPPLPRWVWVLASAALLAGLGLLAPVAQPDGDGLTILGYIESGMHVHWKQPLDFWLHAVTYDLLRLFGGDARQSYAIWAALAGAGYGAAAGACAWAWGRTLWRRLAIWLALLGGGGMILFAGYVESYALVTTSLLAYAWAAWRALEAEGPPWLAGVFLGCAIVLHPLALWALPTVLVWIVRRDRRAIVQLVLALVLPLLIVVVGFSLAGHGPWTIGQHKDAPGGYDGGLFVPLRAANGASERYTLFALAHGRAWLNVLLLAAPALLTTLSWRGRSRFAAWLLLALGGALLWSFLWNPDLGPQQDWDLFSVAGLPILIASAWAIRHLPQRVALALAPAWTGLPILHLLGWWSAHR